MQEIDEGTADLNRALEGRYRIERTIGEGGMATVYLAADLRHDREVALKVLLPDLDSSIGTDRFLEETRIAANLSHPLIVPVYDSGVVGGAPFLVMPYRHGESLQTRLAREGALPIWEAVQIISDVLEALSYAHQEGVVHRDIKPGNILLHGGHALVVDFGIAKALRRADSPDLTRVGTIVGTPKYMAPEQGLGSTDADHRADLYAVGAVAYEILSGRPPFTGDAATMVRRHVADVPLPITTRRPEVPEDLGRFVMKCLEKDPDERWQSAEELLHEIRASTGLGNREIAGPDVGGKKASRPLRIALGGIAVAALAVAAVLGLTRPTDSIAGEPLRGVVAVFDNQTGDPELDAVGSVLQDWLTDGLQRSELLEVVPPITAREAWRFVDQEVASGRTRDRIAALADETRADLVVSGTVYRDGQNLSVLTHVTDAARNRPITSVEPVVGTADNVSGLLNEVQEQLLGSLGASMNRRLEAHVGPAARAPRYEAYGVLNQAIELYLARDYGQASELFLRAFELDTAYAVPLIYASLSLRNAGDWVRSDSAVQILERRREEFSVYQSYWVDYSRAVLEGDLDKARVTIRRAAELAPGSKAVYNWALMAVRMGRPLEAREALGSLDPDRGVMRAVSRYWIRSIEASHQLGDHGRELEEFHELATRHPDDRSVLFQNVRVYAAMGWTDSLQALFRSQRMSRVPPEIIARRYRNAAVELFAHGHHDQARQIAVQGARWIDQALPSEDRLSTLNVGVDITGVGVDITARDEMIYQKARLLEVLGQKAEALRVYTELLETNPRAWWMRGHQGVMLAWMGRDDEARAVEDWLESSALEYGQSAITLWRAGIAARLGERERAVALLQRSRLEGRIWDSLHAWFHLYDALEDYQGFQLFMAPQG